MSATLKTQRSGASRNRVADEMNRRIGPSGDLPKDLRDRTFEAKEATVALPYVELDLRKAFDVLAGVLANQAFAFSDTTLCQLSRRQIDEAMNSLQCAADIQVLLASLTLIATAGTAVGDVCKATGRRLEEELHGTAQLEHLLAEDAASLHRDLASGPRRYTGEARSAEVAACVFDVGQAVLLFSRAGLFINAAVRDCSVTSLNQGSGANVATCAADVGSVVAAFAFAGAGIAESVPIAPNGSMGQSPSAPLPSSP